MIMTNKVPKIFILSMLQLPEIERKTAFKILSQVDFLMSSSTDFFQFIKEQSIRLNLPLFTRRDFDSSLRKAEEILVKSKRNDVKILSYYDEEYPELLKKTTDPPILLNYKGNLDSILTKPSVAIIGTRNASPYGQKYGRSLSRECSQYGFNIVSGLALGCDTAGHLGAIDVNGTTTAVLAHGLDRIYPKENKYLADRILEKSGLLISEYFIYQKPLPDFFVERDRIQAGLSLGTIVIETDIKDRSMHTINFTQEYGRMLGCVNFPAEKRSEVTDDGNRMLISQRNSYSIYEKNELIEFLNLLKSRQLKESIAENISGYSIKDESNKLEDQEADVLPVVIDSSTKPNEIDYLIAQIQKRNPAGVIKSPHPKKESKKKN